MTVTTIVTMMVQDAYCWCKVAAGVQKRCNNSNNARKHTKDTKLLQGPESAATIIVIQDAY